MLATLGGVGLGFLGLAFLFQLYAAPIVGLVSFALIVIFFFGHRNIRANIPATLVILVAGTALAWLTGLAPVETGGQSPLALVGFYFPKLVVAELWEALHGGHILPYLSVVIPIGLLGVLASLQNIESASAAGDSYAARPSLMVNGAGTIAAACFGSPFPTSIYIGHPAWKKLGARAGYSILNGLAITLICISGGMAFLTWAIPAEAGVAIILWIGIIIAVQAFEVTNSKYYPAVIVGFMPAMAAWVMLLVKASVTASGGSVDALLVENAQSAGAFLAGGFALEQGFLYSAMIWAAIIVSVIDQQWRRAAVWSLIGALLSCLGFMHSFVLNGFDSVIHLPFISALPSEALPVINADEKSSIFSGLRIAFAYLLISALFIATPWFSKQQEYHDR